MADQKKAEIVKHVIRDAASEFLTRESNRTSLITVTNVELYDRGSRATIFFTVFPDGKENAALEFVKRKRSEFREFLKTHTKVFHLPFVDFALDLGEKNRQRIEEIASKNKKDA